MIHCKRLVVKYIAKLSNPNPHSRNEWSSTEVSYVCNFKSLDTSVKLWQKDSSSKSLKYKQHKHLWGNDSDRKSPKTTSYRWKPAGAICPKSANGQVCGLPNINTFGTERYEMNWWSKHFDKICHSNRLHLVAPFCIAVHNSISFLFLFSLFLFFFFSFNDVHNSVSIFPY